MYYTRLLRTTAVIMLLAMIIGAASGCGLGKNKPSIGSSMAVGVGAQPGSQAWNDQRITFEANISNTDARPIVGWNYRLVVAPLIAGRVIGSKHETVPAPGTAGVFPNLDPGQSVTIKGYFDFQADGLTKQAISDAEPLVELIITDASGNEIARLGQKGK